MGTALAFGCPECGRKIRLNERSPGRRVRCGSCGTLIEVPFFPRQIGRKRSRHRRWRLWATLGLIVASGVIVPTVAWRWWSGAVRAERVKDFDNTLALIDQAEREEDLSSAFRAAEAALEIAERSGIEPPGGLDPLKARRDGLARTDAAEALDSLPSQPPEQALRQALIIAKRVDADPALSSMSVRVSRAVTEAAARWTDELLDRANEASASGQQAEAMEIFERLASGLDQPPTSPMADQRKRVRQAATALIERYGVRIEPFNLVTGPVSDPQQDDSRNDVLPAIQEALKSRGYLVGSSDSRLADLWSNAPFHLRCGMIEKLGGSYLQSPHRTSLIAIDLVLDRDGQAIWKDYFEARTRVPLQGLSAMESSRMVLGSQSSPEIERRLYRDARHDLLTKLLAKLNTLPPP